MIILKMNIIAISVMALIVYIGFGFAVFFGAKLIRKTRHVNYLIIVPILLSFFSGLAMLTYALSQY